MLKTVSHQQYLSLFISWQEKIRGKPFTCYSEEENMVKLLLQGILTSM